MFPLITALNLFFEKNGLNYDAFLQNHNRKFKSGHISPFSANVAFVLHKCSIKNQNLKMAYDEYKVSFLINEMPIELYGINEKFMCKNSDESSNDLSTCSYLSFKKMMQNFLDDTFDDVCTPDKHPFDESVSKINKNTHPTSEKYEL